MRMTGLWWWIDRWRTSDAFRMMTLEEQGAYRNLLDEAALSDGLLPNDDRILAKASGDATRWPALRKQILAKFTLTAAGWRNDTLDAVLKESRLRSEKQRAYRNRQSNGRGQQRA